MKKLKPKESTLERHSPQKRRDRFCPQGKNMYSNFSLSQRGKAQQERGSFRGNRGGFRGSKTSSNKYISLYFIHQRYSRLILLPSSRINSSKLADMGKTGCFSLGSICSIYYAPGDDSPHGGILLLLCPYVCMYVCPSLVKVFGWSF